MSVISSCAKGDMACARAAELLSLSSHVKRLKRVSGKAAQRLWRTPAADGPAPAVCQPVRQAVASPGPHHLRRLQRSSPLRKTLRGRGLLAEPRNPAPSVASGRDRLAPQAPRSRPSPAPSALRPRRRTGATRRLAPRLARRPRPAPHRSRPARRRHRQNPRRPVLPLRSRRRLSLACSASLLRRHGVPLAFYGDHSGIFVRNDDHWSVEEQLAGKRQPTQFGRALEQLGITFIAAQSPQAKGRIERLWGVLQDRSPANFAWPGPRSGFRQRRPARLPRRLQPPLRPPSPRNCKPPGVRLRKIWTASAASFISASSATTTSCNGTASASRSPSKPNASALPEPKCRSIKLWKGESRSITAIPDCTTPWLRQGDIFMLPLG